MNKWGNSSISKCRLFHVVAGLALLSVAILLALGEPAKAQVSTASVVGTVRDETGAVIKGAHVTVTQTGTGVSHTFVTGIDGTFGFPLLPVGNYTLDVQYPGFTAFHQTGIVLTVGQAASFNVSLKPGSENQTVRVTANASIVQTTESNSSTLVDQAEVVGLPLNGRNPATLVFDTGGTNNPVQNVPESNTGNAVLQNSLVYPSEIAPTIHGIRGGGVYFSLDGANNMDTYQMTGGPFPNPDAVQEFSVVSGNYGAQYVSAPGGAVNIVTKSGTNQIHGDLFEFIRNGAVNARNFFSNQPDVLKRNQFGATLGAPIIHNRWFIFGSYQGTRLSDSLAGLTANVPTKDERSGDFSSLLSGSHPVQLTDPFTGQQIAGDRMTPDMLDPVTQALLKYIPLPNPSIVGKPYNYVYSSPISQTENQYVVKSDLDLRNHRIFGRFFYDGFNWTPNGIPGGDILASYRGQNHTWDNATFGDTWVKGNWVMDSRFTFVRDDSITEAGENSVDLHSLGTTNFTPGQFPTIQSLGVSGYFSIVPGNYNNFPRHTFVVSEDVNFLRGRNHVSFGGDVQHIYTLLRTDNQQNATVGFSGVFSGNALADYMLGAIGGFTQSDGIDVAASGSLPGFYGQDVVQATNRLTLTLGLRWDPFIPFQSQGNRISCWQPGEQSKAFLNAPTGLTFPGDPGCNSAGANSSYWSIGDWEPRFGFAYELDSTGKTVLRGGYGVYSTQFPMFSFLGFGLVQPFLRSITNPFAPIHVSNPWATFPGGNPFANGFELNLGQRPANTPFINPALAVTVNPGFKLAYVQQWSLILERAITANDAVTISYFGTKGTHLSLIQDDNQAVYVAGVAGSGCTVGQYGTTAAGQPCSTQGNIQSRRPDPLIGPIRAEFSGGNSIYNGLEADYRHRFSAGFTLSSAFTYGRSIDDQSSPANTILAGGSFVSIPNDPSAFRGPSDFNQLYTWRTDGVWNLPFGKNFKGVSGVAASGWQLSGILTREGGLPYSVFAATNPCLCGAPTDQFANLLPGVPRTINISANTAAMKGLPIINASAFTIPPAGQFGDSGRNSLYAPGLTNLDVSLAKEFALTERLHFQFRSDFFNSLNHPQFLPPAAGVPLPPTVFGTLSGARDPRILQFSGKLLF
jgi:hypothetical protein